MNDSIEATRPSEPAPAAVAATQTLIENHFTLVVPPAPRAAAPAVARPKPAPAAPVPAAPAIHPISVLPLVTETHSRDANGHAVTKFEDGTGASVTLRGRHNGELAITLQDATRVTSTVSDKNGFTGSTLYTVPQLGTPQQIKQLEAAKGTSGASFLLGRIFNGDVTCGKESASVSDDVIDAVTRERLQAFAKDHPALAAKLKQSKEKVTVIGGVPATMEQVENAPASHKACPENMRGIGAVQAR